MILERSDDELDERKGLPKGDCWTPNDLRLGQAIDVWPMFLFPQTSYGETMLPAHPHPRHDPLRVFCSTCTHSEFVHGDFDRRACLYSECKCSGLDLAVSA